MSSVRERMAPSPTGWVHIGTIRTYLMCQFHALKTKGKLILRIEDTDMKRSVKNGVAGIIESLELMGIVADEGPTYGGDYGPYIQSERLDIYKKYAEELVEKGHAYYCFCTAERLAKLKEEQTANKEKRRYDGTCKNLTKEQIEENIKNGVPHVIRMKVPKNEVLVYNDPIRGRMELNTDDVTEQVILKADGWPTYHLAVVIDDHLMRVGPVIRGLEWLSSTPKQQLLYRYFGWEMPVYYHVPLVLNPDGQGKLSKRKGNVAVIDFIREGYIKEGLTNFLMLIGWSPDPKVASADEIYSHDFFVENFDENRIKKGSARFQLEKLDSMNAVWIAKLSVEDFYKRVLEWIEVVQKETIVDGVRGENDRLKQLRLQTSRMKEYFEANKEKALEFLKITQTRIKKLSDLYAWLEPLVDEAIGFDEESISKVIPEVAKKHEIIYNLHEAHKKLENWSQEIWEGAIRSLADKYSMKHGDLFMVLRVIITGKKISPPLREFMEIAGREFVSKRFEKYLK